MNSVPHSYWPRSPYLKALVIVSAIGPFAFLSWIPWYLAALPAASGLAGWLGRFLLQLDDDQQPGTGTSIRMPGREVETGSCQCSGHPADIASRSGLSG